MKVKLLHTTGKQDLIESIWDKPEPAKDEIEVKKIDLDSELSKLGNFFLRMNNRDRATVIDLLKKSGVIKD